MLEYLIGLTHIVVTFIVILGVLTTPYGIVFTAIGLGLLFTVIIILPRTM